MSLLVVTRAGKSHDAEHFGSHEIVSGATVTEDGVAGVYEVALFSRRNLVALARTASAPSGAYRFRYLANLSGGYVLVAFDHGASPVSPAISDTPVLTPMTFDF